MSLFLSYREAIAFARKAHLGQQRLDGRAYFSHPMAVMQILLTASDALPREAYIAALLHDTIEDGRADAEGIAAAFGREVADVVLALTRQKRTGRRTDAGREERYLRQLIEANARYPYVLLIKLADRLHNLETSGALPLDRFIQFLDDTEHLYLPAFRSFIHQNSTDTCPPLRRLTEELTQTLAEKRCILSPLQKRNYYTHE